MIWNLKTLFCQTSDDIDNLKKKHEQDMEEFQKQQEVNKARMEQGLQDKLRSRRSRRRRQDQLEP